jgi:hypothetical protein
MFEEFEEGGSISDCFLFFEIATLFNLNFNANFLNVCIFIVLNTLYLIQGRLFINLTNKSVIYNY